MHWEYFYVMQLCIVIFTANVLFEKRLRQPSKYINTLLMVLEKSLAKGCQLSDLFDLQRNDMKILVRGLSVMFNDDDLRRFPANWTCPSAPDEGSPRTSPRPDESRRLKRENLFANGCPANGIKKVALLGLLFPKSKHLKYSARETIKKKHD